MDCQGQDCVQEDGVKSSGQAQREEGLFRLRVIWASGSTEDSKRVWGLWSFEG